MHEAIIREFMTALRTYYAKLTQGKPFSGVETGLFRLYMYSNIVVAGRKLTSFP